MLSDLGSNGIFIALLAVVVLFSFLTNGILLRPQNISNLVVQNGYILVLAIGMVMVIIAGHIDLSVGSVAAFVGACSGVFAVQWGLPWWLSVILSLGIGALVGVWQGFGIAFVGIPGVHRDVGGHADLPRPRPRRARQLEHRLVPRRVPGTRQRLPHRPVRRVRVDPLTLGVGAIAIYRPHRAAGPHAPGPEVRPGRRAHAWFITKLVLISAAIGFFTYALASYKGIPVTLIILACSCWSTAS